ncbi:hypothetical protein D0C36_03770 [Mucilaginibacter conchicola]|uniref:DUF4350 domain-containing protein n=1 Tax=Mucilaginibacter conchicola TaxID=2303333 RepID=A0A372NX29_9SPHI|nr:DUF4350 domain-containing protein [Mucilaginibacter conchicola]RFZ94666.1 hypothetical protein D0C36_03770 [Mucilaginibacter conchicola]
MKKTLLIALFGLLLTTGLKAQTVALDYYFNHETRKAKDGSAERFHYTWEDTTQTGFSKWGNEFTKLGAKVTSIDAAPTAENLSGVKVYIIVDPDTKKENPSPNYITETDADVIANWVKKGGKLVMLANDSANTELQHFNALAGKFGMHFNDDMQLHVMDDAHFEDGAIQLFNHLVFTTARKIYLKDVCSIGLKGTAKPLLKAKNGAVIAAKAKYGKGMVLAVGDPWLYNEYVNGRLPAGFENDKAMTDLASYLLKQQ